MIKLKKALSNTGLFDFDVTREKSTDAGPMLRDATKAFQRLNGIKPNCPTAGRGILPPPRMPPAGPRILDWRGWRCL